MAKARNEQEALQHMKAAFDNGGGLLSAKQPEWTAKKAEAITLAIAAMRRFGGAGSPPIQLVDIGVGDQRVMEQVPAIQDGRCGYLGIEGQQAIHDAAVKRVADWPLATMSLMPISELVQIPPANLHANVVTVLDVIYHIPDDQLAADFMAWLFSPEGAHDYVVISYATNMAQKFDGARGPGQPGFAWFPRTFPLPEGWDEIYRAESNSGSQRQAVSVLERVL